MDELAQARRAKAMAETQRQEAADRARLRREGLPAQTFRGPLPVDHPQNRNGALSTDDAGRIAELEAALDDMVMAAELPGDHCEMANAVEQAKRVLERALRDRIIAPPDVTLPDDSTSK